MENEIKPIEKPHKMHQLIQKHSSFLTVFSFMLAGETAGFLNYVPDINKLEYYSPALGLLGGALAAACVLLVRKKIKKHSPTFPLSPTT